MPLSSGRSKSAFVSNIKAELRAGKPIKQALAIAYSKKGESQDAQPHNIAKAFKASQLAEKHHGGNSALAHRVASKRNLEMGEKYLGRPSADKFLSTATHHAKEALRLGRSNDDSPIGRLGALIRKRRQEMQDAQPHNSANAFKASSLAEKHHGGNSALAHRVAAGRNAVAAYTGATETSGVHKGLREYHAKQLKRLGR